MNNIKMSNWNPNTIVPVFPNPYPFNGDFKFVEKVKELIKKYDLRWAIETGTSSGNTTRQLSELFEKVYTVEVNEAQLEVTKPLLNTLPNVTYYLGSSSDLLPIILKNPSLEGNGLFYLDAHWNQEDWPLLDELQDISESNVKGRSIIVIDDYEIPGVVEGDRYGDRVLNLEYVKEDLMKTGSTVLEEWVPDEVHYRGKLIAIPPNI